MKSPIFTGGVYNIYTNVHYQTLKHARIMALHLQSYYNMLTISHEVDHLALQKSSIYIDMPGICNESWLSTRYAYAYSIALRDVISHSLIGIMKEVCISIFAILNLHVSGVKYHAYFTFQSTYHHLRISLSTNISGFYAVTQPWWAIYVYFW